ncbi:MAG: response regulator [Planctomycetaceae bacterium]|nr:response regulator [Planctomycetaceae bacterium]
MSHDLRIAVVEDNSLVRDSLVTVLRLRQLSGVGFVSAEEFLAATDRASFVAILVDYRLPGLDGLQLLSRLRDDGCTTPAILMSGNFDHDVQDAADQLGDVATLRKPCHPELMLQTLQALLNERSGS